MKNILTIIENIYKSTKNLVILIFVLSIFFSAVFLIFFKKVGPIQHAVPGTDYLTCYAPMAENMLAGKGIILNEDSYVRCAPGYPIFLLPIFYLSSVFNVDKISLITIANVILAALSSLILFFIAKIIFGKRIALLTSLFWMTYPFNLWFLKNPNTEAPFIFLLYLGTLIYLIALQNTKNRLLLTFFVGVVLGINSLIRPIGIGFSSFLIISLPLLLKKEPLKIKLFLVVALIVGNLLAILPWETYVFLKTEKLIPISEIGPGSTLVGFSFAADPSTNGYQFKTSSDILEMMKRIKPTEEFSNKVGFSGTISILGDEFLKQPIVFTELLILKAVRSWYATSEMWLEDKILAVQMPYLIFAILGVFYSIKLYKEKISYIALLFILIFYFWLMTTTTFSIVRYIIPAMGFVIFFVAIFIDFLFRRLGVNKKYAFFS